MATPLKSTVDFDDTLDRLWAKSCATNPNPAPPKHAYRLTVDFGKYGLKTNVASAGSHSRRPNSSSGNWWWAC